MTKGKLSVCHEASNWCGISKPKVKVFPTCRITFTKWNSSQADWGPEFSNCFVSCLSAKWRQSLSTIQQIKILYCTLLCYYCELRAICFRFVRGREKRAPTRRSCRDIKTFAPFMFPPVINRPRPNDNEAYSKVCANIWPTKRSKPHKSGNLHISCTNLVYLLSYWE